MRRMEDVTELLWGSRVSASTVSNLNQKVYGKIEENREVTLAKVKDVERKLREMKLNSAADMYATGVGETLTYLEIRRRTRVVGCLQKHPRLGYENMQACFRITRLAAFSRTGNRP